LQEHKKIRAKSDGSLDPDEELASFGWHLIGKGNVLVEGAGPVDGVPDTLRSSMWAELFSIAAIDEFLHHFCTFHNITSTSHVIKCCDNKAAFAHVNRTRRKFSQRRRIFHDVDVLALQDGRIHSEDSPQLGQGSSGQDETI
jgi:hypothetical protein